MFDIGFTEMMLVAVIALVVLGPERLPMVARKAGKIIGNSRRMFFRLQEELSRETSALDKSVKTQLSSFEESVKKTEQGMHAVFSLDNKDKDKDTRQDKHEEE